MYSFHHQNGVSAAVSDATRPWASQEAHGPDWFGLPSSFLTSFNSSPSPGNKSNFHISKQLRGDLAQHVHSMLKKQTGMTAWIKGNTVKLKDLRILNNLKCQSQQWHHIILQEPLWPYYHNVGKCGRSQCSFLNERSSGGKPGSCSELDLAQPSQLYELLDISGSKQEWGQYFCVFVMVKEIKKCLAQCLAWGRLLHHKLQWQEGKEDGWCHFHCPHAAGEWSARTWSWCLNAFL